jgi:hypothetical protein
MTVKIQQNKPTLKMTLFYFSYDELIIEVISYGKHCLEDIYKHKIQNIPKLNSLISLN